VSTCGAGKLDATRGIASLRMSPAMAAGISDKVWSMTDVAEMIDATLPQPGPRGPYKKRAPASDRDQV